MNQKTVKVAAKKASVANKNVVTEKVIAVPPTINANSAKKVARINTQGWIHIIPRAKKWVVRLDGANRALKVYESKSDALKGAETARGNTLSTRIIVHDTNREVANVIQ